jgi:hypothetical protein
MTIVVSCFASPSCDFLFNVDEGGLQFSHYILNSYVCLLVLVIFVFGLTSVNELKLSQNHFLIDAWTILRGEKDGPLIAFCFSYPCIHLFLEYEVYNKTTFLV